MSIKESTELKGVAIILMFMHHLFGCGTFLVLSSNVWNNTIPNLNVEKFIGVSGKICVAIFVFLSGYGLYKSYIQKQKLRKHENLIRILKFCISYWGVLFLVAIPYLLLAGKIDINNVSDLFIYLFVNLFALLHDDNILYVSFSWYVKVYLGLLLLLPVLRWFMSKNKKLIYDALFLTFIAIFSFLTKAHINEQVFTGIFSFLISSVLQVISFVPIFYAGIICAKYSVYEKIDTFFSKMNKVIVMLLGIIIMIMTLFIRYKINIFWTTDIVYSTVFCIGWHLFANNVKFDLLKRLLQFLGKHSFQYWLISGMFFLNTIELQKILFIFSKNALIILIWKFVIITPFAIVVKVVSDKISTYLQSVIVKS